jgi:hypothetical protein
MHHCEKLAIAFAGFLCVSTAADGQDWKPVPGHLATRWAAQVSPDNVWPEYPRPTLVRERWANLNGLWSYAIAAQDSPRPTTEAGRILVPFPIESSLSGVGKAIGPAETLWYWRSFTVPTSWKGQRVLLHFGAVDWRCAVEVNGKPVGEHTGGYDPFTFDITDRLHEGPNELVVRVTDPTNAGGQPRGKQWNRPHGIWYTPTSGIWQTAWLEPVPATAAIRSLQTRSSGTEGWVEVAFTVKGHAERDGCLVEILDGEKVVVSQMCRDDGTPTRLTIPSPRAWTPAAPVLYDVVASVKHGHEVLDRVKSYVALRDVRMGHDERGINRLLLNGKPIFHFGPLDQGFWPDGLYTPPSDEAMRFDIEAVKKMGGNMLRKHVKVESERFYTWCDRLGVMVWQDMPSPFFESKAWDEDFPALSDEWKRNFESELKELIADRGNHPSIVMWVPFNEGWGQNDLAWSKAVVDSVKGMDPSRLVNCASGWTDTGNGDVLDIHVYPGPGTAAVQPTRAVVLGEFGGLGLPVEGHTWLDKNNWGYVSYKTSGELTAAYVGLVKQLPFLIADGLCAAVYTQTTDVEIEVNGWLTYDRSIWKVDPEQAGAAARRLQGPPPSIRTLVPHAGQGPGAVWAYTTSAPPEGWMKPGFVPGSEWKQGAAGFGTAGTPGAALGTPWTTSDIWIRREVVLDGTAKNPFLTLHHDEDTEVFIDGEPAVTLKGFTTNYAYVPLSDAAARAVQRAGRVVLAIHCKQTTGGQYIDCGLVDVFYPDPRN